MKSAFLVAALLASIAAPSSAQVNLTQTTPSYSYFHRVGADLATHDAELLDCLRNAGQTRTFDMVIHNDSGLFAAAMTSFEQQRNIAVNTENCMVVKGWQVVTIGEASGDRLMKQSSAEVAQGFLAERVGEAQVLYGVVRNWRNDAASSTTVRYAVRPNYSGKPSISVKGLDPDLVKQATSTPGPAVYSAKVPKTAIPKEIKAKQLAAVAPGTSIIVARVRNVSFKHSIGFAFERISADPMVPAWVADNQVAAFGVYQALLGAKTEGKFVAVAVPAGRWRLSSMGIAPVLNFCLGSPSFELKAGEVVFAGTFDMGEADFNPDMDMTDARAFLAARPDLAEQVRPADWTNGWTGKCGDSVIYALEFSGLPFASGYTDGSARSPAPAVLAPVAPPAPASVP